MRSFAPATLLIGSLMMPGAGLGQDITKPVLGQKCYQPFLERVLTISCENVSSILSMQKESPITIKSYDRKKELFYIYDSKGDLLLYIERPEITHI